MDGATQMVRNAASGQNISMDQLKQQVSESTKRLNQIDTVKGTLQSSRYTNAASSITSADSEYAHKDYYNQIALYANLMDPSTMRTISHNFAIEKLWMLCESGQQSKMEEFMFSYCGATYEWDTKDDKKENISLEKASANFIRSLKLDIEAQHNVNMTLLNVDHTARKEYLAQQLALVESMVEQQNTLIQSLNDWSQYMNQRAEEYAKLYERMSVIVHTTKRKDVFEVKDLRSLDGWNLLATNTFWVLLVVLLVMVVVQYQSELTAMATQVNQSVAKNNAVSKNEVDE